MNMISVEFLEMVLDIWMNDVDGLLKITLIFQMLGRGRSPSDDELTTFKESYVDEDGDMTRELLAKMVRERYVESSGTIFVFLLTILSEHEYERFLSRDF